MGQSEIMSDFLSQTFRRRKWYLFGVLLIWLVASAFSIWSSWNGWVIVDRIVMLATLAIAFLVFVLELLESYKQDLPKRLNLYFLLPKDAESPPMPLLVCKDVWLAGEGDLRQWSQQIGAQMTGTRGLQFDPYIHEEPIGIKKTPEGTKANYFRVIINLTALPQQEVTPIKDTDSDEVKTQKGLAIERNQYIANANQEGKAIVWTQKITRLKAEHLESCQEIAKEY